MPAPVLRPIGVGRGRAADAPPARVGSPAGPADEPIRITHERVMTGRSAARLCDAYEVSFGPLAPLAIQHQSDNRERVLVDLADERILKIVAWQGDEPVGLGMVTNHLELLEQISAPFLQARFPEHSARGAVFVGMYVMVASALRGLTIFSRVYTEMWQVPARVGGVLVFDVCEFNRTTFDADGIAQRIADTFPHADLQVIDRQTWYAVELPEPLENFRP